jgi:DNA-binding transcriptional MerR regulator/methylmalonyl-CoA mutase cobalamin-binding subunit
MYTIKEAALRAGISVPLLRAWERRYGIVEPTRTAAGYRLYDEASIERVRAMRRLVDSGWSASQAAREIETRGVVPDSEGTVSRPQDDSIPTNAIAQRDVASAFVDAATALDERRVDGILDDLFATGSFERVVDALLMPALRALGDAWAAGTMSVGAEHAASHAVLRRLAASFEAAGASSADRPILVGLPPGSRHEIGALAFATTLRRQGLGVVYLGADVPVDSWAEAVRATRAAAVVIGIPTSADGPGAADVANAVAQRVDSPIVAAGGPGSVEAPLPASVVRLPDGMVASARALQAMLAVAQGGRGG